MHKSLTAFQAYITHISATQQHHIVLCTGPTRAAPSLAVHQNLATGPYVILSFEFETLNMHISMRLLILQKKVIVYFFLFLWNRACRLKKKAQHEANKIKLSGLDDEHSKFSLKIFWTIQKCFDRLVFTAIAWKMASLEEFNRVLFNRTGKWFLLMNCILQIDNAHSS